MKTSRLHAVHFYEDEHEAMELVARFLGGEQCIVIATPEHRQMIAQRIGTHHALDAQQTLDRFMVNGTPDQERFEQIICPLLQSGTRAYGEMVTLLLEQGNPEAAIRLDELWKELQQEHDFDLLRTYPLRVIEHTRNDVISRICKTHAMVEKIK